MVEHWCTCRPHTVRPVASTSARFSRMLKSLLSTLGGGGGAQEYSRTKWVGG